MDRAMNDVAFTAGSFIVTAIFWGCTNPLLKRASSGVELIHRENRFRQSLAEIWFLVTKWQYVVVFGLNQLGSVIYFMTLANAQLSLAVPIVNSLTFVFTGLTGSLVGETFGGRGVLLTSFPKHASRSLRSIRTTNE